MIAVALGFLIAYAVPIVHPTVSAGVASACSVVIVVSWVLFGADYLIRVALADRRWRFVRRNLFDLAVLTLPLLRPLRLLRLVAMLSILNRTTAANLRGRVVLYAAGGASLLLLSAGLAITDEERHVAGTTITSFGEGMWWAITTMTTVGYGDRYPVTATGRLIASALMIGGIALLGVVTAILSSWLVERVAEANDADRVATQGHIDQLAEQLSALHAELRELRRSVNGDPGGRDEGGQL